MSIKFVNNNKSKPLSLNGKSNPSLSLSSSATTNGSLSSLEKSKSNQDPNTLLSDIFSRLTVSSTKSDFNDQKLKDLIQICTNKDAKMSQEKRREAAVEVAVIVNQSCCSLSSSSDNHLNTIKSALESSDLNQREGALLLMLCLLKFVNGKRFVPVFQQWLGGIIDKSADKNPSIRSLSMEVASLIVDNVHAFGVESVLPILFSAMEKTGKWQTRQFALKLLSQLTNACPHEVSQRLPDIIPHVAECMADIKNEVKNEGYSTMNKLAQNLDNQDIEKVIPALVECIGDPSTVPQCIKAVSATTFVRDIESPVLAIMVPLLVRALAVRNNTSMLRQTTVIIDNMCKLVKNPESVSKFLPDLLPGLERIVEMGTDPEVRQIAKTSYDSVKSLVDGSSKSDEHNNDSIKNVDKMALNKTLGAALQDGLFTGLSETTVFAVMRYMSQIIHNSFLMSKFHEDVILEMRDYLLEIVQKEKAESVINEIYHKLRSQFVKESDEDENDADAHEVLCNCQFSLAYGGMILLKDARLKLRRGDRYGVLGKNGCGKTTLLTAISKGQLEGFPKADKCKTAYVSHISQIDDSNDDSVIVRVKSKVPQCCEEEIVDILRNKIGMSEAMLNFPVNSLSGGWKMKLELGLAMLHHADILLLDEPTNHLDSTNVQWLVNYLLTQKTMTALIISHDSKFLDNVCSHIIYYDTKKLRTIKGNFSKVRQIVPEIQSYIEYETPNFSFKFPVPGNLDLVKSKERKILRLKDVNYSYPGTDRQVLFNVNIGISLASRVAIVGPNGAGKSTMIKLLTGETLPDSGTLQKHPNLRIAYVAQHAFHHLEEHLDMSPNQYIRWRYEFGQDKELLAKESRKISEKEKSLIEDRRIECICGRQKVKRSFKYEIKLLGHKFDETIWVDRERLIELGFKSLVQNYDDQVAARNALERELTVASVQAHLEDFGLNAEFGTHNVVKGLSGGQKVKVVLAAAMWMKPHILVLDEPTNYLDVQSLNALANAIREFQGGVVMITHNANFYESLCDEIWEMNAGRLNCVRSKKGLETSAEDIDSGLDAGSTSNVQQADEGEEKDSEVADDPDGKLKKTSARRKETRRERIEKNKRKLAKLKKYGPKPDGTEYSSDEEVEVFINVGG